MRFVEAGKRVRLVDDRRDAAQRRRDEHRAGRVAADAEDDVRAVLADEAATPARSRAGGAATLRIRSSPPFPFSPPTEMNSSGKPAFGTIVFSRPRSVPTKTTLRDAIARDVLARDGDGGIDVPSRPAARDHQCLHARHAHRLIVSSIVVKDSEAARPP